MVRLMNRECDLPSEPQYEAWRRMTPDQKYGLFQQHMATVREVKRSGVRTQHPDWSAQEAEREVARLFLRARS